MITVCGNVFTVYPQYLGNKDMYIQMNKRTNTLSCSLTSCYPPVGGRGGLCPPTTGWREKSLHPSPAEWRGTSNHHYNSGGTPLRPHQQDGREEDSLHSPPQVGWQPLSLPHLHPSSLTLGHLCLHTGKHYHGDTYFFETTNFIRHEWMLVIIIIHCSLYWELTSTQENIIME